MDVATVVITVFILVVPKGSLVNGQPGKSTLILFYNDESILPTRKIVCTFYEIIFCYHDLHYSILNIISTTNVSIYVCIGLSFFSALIEPNLMAMFSGMLGSAFYHRTRECSM